MEKTILVVGGAGYIGSQVNRMLIDKGYKTIIFDNLSTGNKDAVASGLFVNGDLQKPSDIDAVFSNNTIDAVMHFAACIAVGESVEDPAKYYNNNVTGTLNLLNAMLRHDVKKIIFSSSAAIFGEPQQESITETHRCSPINPYGMTKLIVEHILEDYDHAYGLRSCSLRYFNAAGGDPREIAKSYNMRSLNLVPVILNSLSHPGTVVKIFGTDYDTPDGTCVRDYIHTHDLGAAHIIALERLFAGEPTAQYNLGNGSGYSVREVIAAAERVIGVSINAVDASRRAGDPPILVANSTKAREELGWQPKYPDLDSIIKHQWKAMP